MSLLPVVGSLSDIAWRIASISQHADQVAGPELPLYFPPFPPGYQSFDLPPASLNPTLLVQNQLARHSNDQVSNFSIGLELRGKDNVPPGNAWFDTPIRGLFISNVAQNSGARISQAFDQVHATPQPLVGKDKFFGTAGKAPNYDEPNPLGFLRQLRTQADTARIANDPGQIDGVLPGPLRGKDKLRAAGQPFEYDETQQKLLQRFYAWINSYHFIADLSCAGSQIGNGILPTPLAVMPVGEQIFDLSPAHLLPAHRDYTFAVWYTYQIDYVTQPYQEFYELPPKCFSSFISETSCANNQIGNGILPTPTVSDIPVGESTLDSKIPVATLHHPSLHQEYAGNSTTLINALSQSPGIEHFDLPPTKIGRTPDSTWQQGLIPNLIGQDAVNPGEQWFDLPPIATLRARDYSITHRNILYFGQDTAVTGQQSADLPPKSAPRLTDYTWTNGLIPNLIGQDAFAVGEQYVDFPVRAALRLYDYSSYQNSWLVTISAVTSVVPGVQNYDVPPHSTLRLAEYTWAQSLVPNLVGQDSLIVGVQFSELPPRAPQRAPDYTFSGRYTLELLGQDAIPVGDQSFEITPRAPTRTSNDAYITNWNNLRYFGKDSLPVGIQAVELPPKLPPRQPDDIAFFTTNVALLPEGLVPPTGAHSLELAPRAALRLTDYTWLQSLVPNLVGQDTLVPGKQYFEIPPKAALRNTTDVYTTSWSNVRYFGQDTLIIGKQSFELSPPAPLRARDYSIIHRNVGYFGQDALVVGQQSFDLPTKAAPRQPDDIAYFTSAIALLPEGLVLPVGNKVFDFPPIAPLRLKEYTWTQNLVLTLIGQDALPTGKSLFDLSPHAALRAVDYTWTGSLIPDLVGKDSLVSGKQSSDIPPSSALRLRDYSVTNSFPLSIVYTFSIPQGQQLFDVAPLSALRARDYSITHRNVLYLGQDALIIGSQVFDLAPKAPARQPDDIAFFTNNIALLPEGLVLPCGEQTYDLPHIAQRLSDYSITHRDILYFGQDSLVTGEQIFDLAPPATLRLREYTWTQILVPNLVGQDARLVGNQSTELPPHAALRQPDDIAYITAGTPLVEIGIAPPVGEQSIDLSPRSALRLSDYTHFNSLVPILVGKDKLATGKQYYDLPPIAAPRQPDDIAFFTSAIALLPEGLVLPVGKQVTDLAPIAPLKLRDYTWVESLVPNLIGQDALVTGAQIFDLAPSATPRLVEYTWIQSLVPVLVGRDSVTAGKQYFDLPPKPAPRQPDDVAYFTSSVSILVEGLTLPSGRQQFELTPKSAVRLLDYTWTQNLVPVLVGQDELVTGVQIFELAPLAAQRLVDYTWTQSLVPVLVGQDALVTGEQQVELTPKAPATLVDYTWLQSLVPNLIGQDQLPSGTQIFDLSPAAAAILVDYTWTESLIPNLIGQDELVTGEQTFEVPRGALRAPDYTWIQDLIPNLFGQDAMLVGDQLTTQLPPIGPLIAKPIFDQPNTLALLITTAQAQLPDGSQWFDLAPISQNPTTTVTKFIARLSQDRDQVHGLIPQLVGKDKLVTGKQSFDLSVGSSISSTIAWSRIARQSQQYDQVHSLIPQLVGKDKLATGKQSFDLPTSDLNPNPLAQNRIARISQQFDQVHGYVLGLIGKDTLPAGDKTFDIPPKASLRLVDYTWIQGLIPNLIGQDALIVGNQVFDLAPIAPLRAPDYTWIENTVLNLIGQDALPVGSQVSDLPPYAPLRAPDYTWTETLVPNLVGQDERLAGIQSFEIAPRVSERDYTWIQAVSLTQTSGPIGEQVSEILPQKRVTDYTWTQWLTLQLAIPNGKQVFNIPAGPSRPSEYTWSQSLIPTLVGKDAVVTGEQFFDLTPQAPVRARDYSITSWLALELLGVVTPPPGKQSTDLSPKAPTRLSDYTIAHRNILYFGRDALTVGDQTFDRPRGSLRLVDYTWIQQSLQSSTSISTQSFELPQRTRLRDFTWIQTHPLTQDIIVGKASTDLPVYVKKPDYYSLTESVSQLLISAFPIGQISADLPQISRQIQYEWQQSLAIFLNSQSPVPGQQLSELPPSASLRAPDYSITESFALELVGQDALPVGEQFSDLSPVAPAPRDNTYFDGRPSLLLLAVFPPEGQQSTELPPKTALRAPDYTVDEPTAIWLIGQGFRIISTQSTELPPPAAPRATDYTFINTFNTYLFRVIPRPLDSPITTRPNENSFGTLSNRNAFITKNNTQSKTTKPKH